MKYVYLRGILKTVAILLAILGPFMCFQNAWDEHLDNQSQQIQDTISYGYVSKAVEEDGNIIMSIACMKSILCIGIGILLYKKIDQIIEVIMKRSNTQEKETIAEDTGDKYDKLAKLQNLKEDGVITEAEFESEKAKI